AATSGWSAVRDANMLARHRSPLAILHHEIEQVESDKASHRPFRAAFLRQRAGEQQGADGNGRGNVEVDLGRPQRLEHLATSRHGDLPPGCFRGGFVATWQSLLRA